MISDRIADNTAGFWLPSYLLIVVLRWAEEIV